MTGLDLEGFLRLLRVDVASWATLGIALGVLAVLTWTSWGSRRALRKCLVLSILAHLGLAYMGRRLPVAVDFGDGPEGTAAERIREVRVTPTFADEAGASPDEGRGPGKAAWDRPNPLSTPPAPDARPRRAEVSPPPPERVAPAPVITPDATPAAAEVAAAAPEPRAEPAPAEVEASPITPPVDVDVNTPVNVVSAPAEPSVDPTAGLDRLRVRAPLSRPTVAALPDRPRPVAPAPAEPAPTPATAPPPPAELRPEVAEPPAEPATAPGPIDPEPVVEVPAPRVDPRPVDVPGPAMPDSGRVRPSRAPADDLALAPRRPTPSIPADRATPGPPPTRVAPTPRGPRPLPEVPEVYRSRLDPNRSALAQRAGASPASEQAVERALDWLARHQDSDGRWNAGTNKAAEGVAGAGDRSFTLHCPPGETCAGECYYSEADTGLTGLSLLAFLGAGYTHVDGKYARNVETGLRSLIAAQRPDGDLMGAAHGYPVGMYCHAMASLALCEAYALTGDARLRGPVEKAVSFVLRSRSADGLAWRYTPGDASRSDTSVLGWMILLLKSAKVVGIDIPPDVPAGAAKYLGKVAQGRADGLASYRPDEPPKPTMTAEAWVCRQFLGVGGPGPASEEAARYLLANGPDKGEYNLYYWYYGTLAMYQQGGASWNRWNAGVRDRLVGGQEASGHRAGSWDPEDCRDKYDSKGGRIYCTAIATLTLEVYYRYLRLYDSPAAIAPPRPQDSGLQRAAREIPPPRPR